MNKKIISIVLAVCMMLSCLAVGTFSVSAVEVPETAEVGGGSQDMYLNQMTADATKLTVYAGPTEGTALGNLLVQMITEKEIGSLAEARNIIRESFEIKEVKPR